MTTESTETSNLELGKRKDRHDHDEVVPDSNDGNEANDDIAVEIKRTRAETADQVSNLSPDAVDEGGKFVEKNGKNADDEEKLEATEQNKIIESTVATALNQGLNQAEHLVHSDGIESNDRYSGDDSAIVDRDTNGTSKSNEKRINELSLENRETAALLEVTNQVSETSAAATSAATTSSSAVSFNTSSALHTTTIPTGGYSQSSLDEMTFSIPNEMVGVVIGRGGENIQKIQRGYGISIQIAKSQDLAPGATSRQVMLKGPSNTLTYAKLEVDRLIAGAKSNNVSVLSAMTTPTTMDSMKMAVPNDKVGLIIGKQGGTIKGIQVRTQAHVQIPAEADADDNSRRTITISAPTKVQVDRAMREIQNVIDVGSGNPSSANTVIMQVPNDRVGLVIGKGGVTIKELQNRTGARIQIPPAPDPGTNVRSMTITGVGDAPLKAKFEMEQLLANANTQFQRAGTNFTIAPVFNTNPFAQQSPPFGASLYAQQHYPQQQPYSMPSSQGPPNYVQPFQQHSDPYSHMQPRPVQPVQAQNPVPRAAGGVDLTQYHTQFWQYAAYYGERVAREQYGPWAPPVGTAPPPGIILPMPGQEQSAAATGQR